MKQRILTKILAALLVFSMSISAVSADESPTDETPHESNQEDLQDESTDDLTLPPFLQEPTDDMGNAQLVERQDILFSDGIFELISVTTRSGNVFYIFIRHDLPSDTANVCFS
jgi:hypothetical protein